MIKLAGLQSMNLAGWQDFAVCDHAGCVRAATGIANVNPVVVVRNSIARESLHLRSTEITQTLGDCRVRRVVGLSAARRVREIRSFRLSEIQRRYRCVAGAAHEDRFSKQTFAEW